MKKEGALYSEKGVGVHISCLLILFIIIYFKNISVICEAERETGETESEHQHLQVPPHLPMIAGNGLGKNQELGVQSWASP